MDLQSIEQSLPNGFHDACLTGLALSFPRRDVELLFDALMANDDVPAAERYRRCRLVLRDCAVVILEPAVAYREIRPSEGLQIDQTQLKEKDYQAFKDAGYTVPPANFWLALFVYDWNSRIVVNARDAILEFL